MIKKIIRNAAPLMMAVIMVVGMTGCGNKESDTTTEATTEVTAEETAEATAEATEDTQENVVDTNTLTIQGLGEEAFSFTLEEVMAFEPYEEEISSTTSSGEIKTAAIKGATLDDLLESKGYTTANCESIRIVASDGYEIAVPSDVIANKTIVVAYEENGAAYDEFGAFRVVIPDERAMYWVRGTIELNFEYSETVSSEITQIVFLENVYEDVPLEDYTYYESVDQAVSIASLMETYATVTDATSGAFVASDGLETEQTVDVLQTGYIKMTGENAPLFISPDMPKGMQVKGVQYLVVGDTCFTSIRILSESVSGLQEVLSDLDMTGTSYLAIGTDGSETSLSGTAISESTVVVEDDSCYLVNTEESIKIEVKAIQQQ